MNRLLKILVYQEREAAQFAEALQHLDDIVIAVASTPAQALMELPDTEIIFGWKFPTHLLSRPEAASVRWMQVMGAGVDDLMADHTVPSHIIITRVVGQFGRPIAEYVFAYILYLAKCIEPMRASQQKQMWSPLIPTELAGKKIGVAGLGSIGLEIVRKARAFDMVVHGLSLSGQQAHAVDRHFTSAEWTQFVQNLDYVVITLPATSQTYHIVGRQVFEQMKAGTVFINVGRGQIVAEADLTDALMAGRLGAAVLDVFEHEPLPANSPLWALPNVYVTPHISGPSMAADVSRFFLDNLRLYRQSDALYGRVDRTRGY
ncbi:D-2-hydroxyacid dehydrogenase [Alicyclobacillus fodiniaquatilis]|jgi:glyoxylate/hydroxypyruvate reductase A|uniref:D-2-hydroxyacid dehydrogenase n=1 Tax=Alicyclobacillus fodiniaquatilis TaxID=1661150 RepID=A0ABW4JC47_9BACL